MTPTLKLVCEQKISDLLPNEGPNKRLEASDVLFKNHHFFIVFDNRPEIARISDSLKPSKTNGLFGVADIKYGYEGITYNEEKQRYYLLVEAHKLAKGSYEALIVEYDDNFRYLKKRSVDFTFESGNRGFEAVAYARRNGKTYLLALCEGNLCKSGKEGRKPGGGRVQLFVKKRKRWWPLVTIALPPSLTFIDYSGMSIKDGLVAIVSQENSMLWVGEFNEADWEWRDKGQVYEFPRSGDNSIRYGNIEGVSWISPTRIVTVSDRRKKNTQHAKGLSDKDQSVQIFDIPSPA